MGDDCLTPGEGGDEEPTVSGPPPKRGTFFLPKVCRLMESALWSSLGDLQRAQVADMVFFFEQDLTVGRGLLFSLKVAPQPAHFPSNFTRAKSPAWLDGN